MTFAPPAPLTPDRARCRVMKVGARSPSWQWDDLVGDLDPGWLAHPTLPFEREVPQTPEPVGDDVPVELRRLASALARALTEVLSGQRPPLQLSRWLDEPPLRVVSEAAKHYRRLPPTLGSIRLQQTAGGSVEVTLRLDRGDRSSAVAYRLDQRRGRWRCSALVIGP